MGDGDPSWVERDFRVYLRCGILAHGFARARGGGCGYDFVVAFSCGSRGACPSCNACRTAETAAILVDHVLPPRPVRQWVLSVPKRLRRRALSETLLIHNTHVAMPIPSVSPVCPAYHIVRDVPSKKIAGDLTSTEVQLASLLSMIFVESWDQAVMPSLEMA